MWHRITLDSLVDISLGVVSPQRPEFLKSLFLFAASNAAYIRWSATVVIAVARIGIWVGECHAGVEKYTQETKQKSEVSSAGTDSQQGSSEPHWRYGTFVAIPEVEDWERPK